MSFVVRNFSTVQAPRAIAGSALQGELAADQRQSGDLENIISDMISARASTDATPTSASSSTCSSAARTKDTAGGRLGYRAGLVWSSLRARTVGGFCVLLVVVLGTVLGVLLGMHAHSTNELLHDRGRADMHRVANFIAGSETQLRSMLIGWAFWDQVYFYIANGDPHGAFYQWRHTTDTVMTSNGVDAILYILPNGTLFFGQGYDILGRRPRNVSASEVETISKVLLRHGSFTGLVLDPIRFGNSRRMRAWSTHISVPSGETRVTVSLPAARDDGTGEFVGWCIFELNIRSFLPGWTKASGLCIAALFNSDQVRSYFEASLQHDVCDHSQTTSEAENEQGLLEARLHEDHEAIDALEARVAELGLQHYRLSDAIAEAADRIQEAENELLESQNREAAVAARLCACQASNCALQRRLDQLLVIGGIKDDRL
eukprot:m51a1_g4554 hypothetical protein (431) ;mRNA; f:83001-86891